MASSTNPSAGPARAPVLVDLALQSGGAHGAFTWGVLDRLLEEPRLQIEGISGTSAGAMNAAVLVAGHADGGPQGARVALEDFWRRVSRAATFSPFRRSPMDILLGRWTMDTSPVFLAFDLAARLFSPYDLNPGGANPLRDILVQCVDVARIAQSPIRLFVTEPATVRLAFLDAAGDTLGVAIAGTVGSGVQTVTWNETSWAEPAPEGWADRAATVVVEARPTYSSRKKFARVERLSIAREEPLTGP